MGTTVHTDPQIHKGSKKGPKGFKKVKKSMHEGPQKVKCYQMH